MSASQPIHNPPVNPGKRGPKTAVVKFCQTHKNLLLSYLWQYSHIVIMLLDENKTLIDGNQGCVNFLGLPETWLGQPLQSLLFPESVAVLKDFPGPGQESQIRLNFALLSQGIMTLSCRVYHTPQGYVVFGEKPLPSSQDMIRQLAVLTEELTNLNRELAQKNRFLAKANATITRLMRTDPLTGLANRRFFLERLEQALAAARRHHLPLALVLADLDHFKNINDSYGHDVGDEVLKGFAAILRENTRAEDLAARWGGEEFLILLTHTDLEGAQHFAERMRQKLAAQTFALSGLKVTASFGISQLLPGDEAELIIKRADQALYQAKSGGRDRVEVL